jgi:hypothetical protein
MLCVIVSENLFFPMGISNSEYGYLWVYDAWAHVGSSFLVYERIMFWFSEIKPENDFPEITNEVHDWLQRAKHGEEPINLVEEYIDGERYVKIHKCFKDVRE